ncbi:MAG: hypothetical protein ABEJ56_00590 [Candidatus Nanohaloarchaea archaeon]
MGKYILGRLKEKFEIGEEESQEGFPDMNYIVGNTTGKDIGGEPKVLHRRVGRFAQLGGSVAEILIDNPATFQVEREGLLNVLEQLNLDASFHGDANLGFTAAYATRAQGVNYGYNLAHRYFTRFLEQLASFKSVVDRGEYRFETEYVNMHASTAQAPPLEEQIPSDKVMDPFGYPLSNVSDQNGGKKVNIYANKDFMEKIVEFLLIPYVRDVEVYQGLSQINEKFEREWQDCREDELNKKWGNLRGEIKKKASVIQNSRRVDQEIDYEFESEAESVEIGPINPEEDFEEAAQEPPEIENLRDIFRNVTSLVRRVREVKENKSVEQNFGGGRITYNLEDDYDDIIGKLENVLDELWEGEDGLNFEAKQSALINTIDYLQQDDILEDAADEGIKEVAGKAFACKEEFEGIPEERFQRFLEKTRAGRQVEREMEKESTAYYRLIPIWLRYSDQDYGEKHPGWDELKFIWDTIVGNNEDYESYFESREKFREALSEDKDFRSDITAAVGSAYLWGHFTQRETDFESDKPRGPEEWEGDVDEWTSSHDKWTWVEYMNQYGLTVNIESMYGDPSSILRLWRPKDIAVACRAVNRTAQKQFEGWEQDEYRGPFTKFTIDLEHTASFGVDPEREIEIFFDQERELAESGEIDVEPEKAVSDILKTYHLTKPGFEQTGGVGHRHGPFSRGDTVLYRYLYNLVEAGFCRNQDDPGIVMFEIGGDYQEEIYMIRIAMNMIELGIEPEEVKAENVDPSKDRYEDEREALLARFFGLDKPNVDREWAKIEEHAFDPLDGLLEAEGFDNTYSGGAALENENRPQEWKQEEFK